MILFRYTKQTLTRITVALGIGMVLMVGATGLVYSVYLRRSDDPAVRRLAASFPAARLGSRFISYADFLRSRDTLRVYLRSEAAAREGYAQSLTPEIEKNALARLVRQAALEEVAAQRQVRVSDEEVSASFDQLIRSTSTTVPNIAQYLNETFQWTEKDFRDVVLRPALLEERLAATFASSTQDQRMATEAYLRNRLAKPDVKLYLQFGALNDARNISN